MGSKEPLKPISEEYIITCINDLVARRQLRIIEDIETNAAFAEVFEEVLNLTRKNPNLANVYTELLHHETGVVIHPMRLKMLVAGYQEK